MVYYSKPLPPPARLPWRREHRREAATPIIAMASPFVRQASSQRSQEFFAAPGMSMQPASALQDPWKLPVPPPPFLFELPKYCTPPSLFQLPNGHRQHQQPRRPQRQQQQRSLKKQWSSRQRNSGSSTAARRAAKRRRAAAAQQRFRQQPALERADTPVCPPAPFNSNDYLMGCYEQHCAAKQAEQAAAAQLAHAAATGAAADWDLNNDLAGAAAAADCTLDAPSSPVCPPAPYLDNEFYFARFEQQLAAEKAAAAAAAAAAPAVVEAGVAEWDPLLQEVTTFQHSTASSVPAMSLHADDAWSKC